jgi:hypothetical protein
VRFVQLRGFSLVSLLFLSCFFSIKFHFQFRRFFHLLFLRTFNSKRVSKNGENAQSAYSFQPDGSVGPSNTTELSSIAIPPSIAYTQRG